LSEAQKKAFTIADSRLSEIAKWDDRVLAEQLKELSIVNLDFDIEVTGFDMGEIDLRIESLNLDLDETDPADVLPEQTTGEPAAQTGDLWRLGRHRLLCGDALEYRIVIAPPPKSRVARGTLSRRAFLRMRLKAGITLLCEYRIKQERLYVDC
jgi:hypothetical protein